MQYRLKAKATETSRHLSFLIDDTSQHLDHNGPLGFTIKIANKTEGHKPFFGAEPTSLTFDLVVLFKQLSPAPLKPMLFLGTHKPKAVA